MIRLLTSRSNGGFRMKPSLFLVLAVLAVACGMPALADDTRIGVTSDEIQWGQVEGLGLAVILQGDPAKSGPLCLRMKVPPDNITQPHVHRQAETLLSLWLARFRTGHGIDRSRGRVLAAGSFVHLPVNTPHFGWTGADGAWSRRMARGRSRNDRTAGARGPLGGKRVRRAALPSGRKRGAAPAVTAPPPADDDRQPIYCRGNSNRRSSPSPAASG